MYDIRAIAGVLMKDYVSKLFLSDKSIVRYVATTKAQMDCSFHEENVTHRGSWGKRRGERKWHVFTTNQTVDHRIKTHSYC